MQINKYNIHENRNQVDNNYIIGDKVRINNHTAYKYEKPYIGTFVITRYFTHGTVNLKYGQTKVRCDIRQINPYKYDTNVDDISSKNMSRDDNI